jgi:osmotically-inducible protein OsmY
VLGVIDQIAVTPMSRPDEDIRKDVLTALFQDPATESYQVAVAVQNGIVTLTGSVGSYAEKLLAEQVAAGVKGSSEIHNNVTVNYLAKRTDPEIAGDVEQLLKWDIWLNGNPIKAAVKDGKVSLTGTVGSAISAAQAFNDGWVAGVTSVDDSGIKIDPQASDAARLKLKYAEKSDDEIKQAVQAALHQDPRVAAFSPDVTVEEGVVILGGTVGNLKAETSAVQDAKNVVSVWQVDDQLKVGLKEGHTDAEMTKELKAALYWDSELDNSTIDAAVVNRTAYLSGSVDEYFQLAEAQNVASRIKGVAVVTNHLKFDPGYSLSYDAWPYYDWPYDQTVFYNDNFSDSPAFLSDDQIKTKIEKALFWSPFVDRSDIKVTVSGAVATLTGTVGTWIGYGEADKDAHKSGATAVLNHISVKKGAWWW